MLTTHEVHQVLQARGIQQDFPLFHTMYKIVTGELPPSAVADYRVSATKVAILLVLKNKCPLGVVDLRYSFDGCMLVFVQGLLRI